MSATLKHLKSIEALQDVPDQELQWLIENSEERSYETGDTLFSPGDPLDEMLIMLEGKGVFKLKRGNNFRTGGEWDDKAITGLLPYSRGVETKALGTATAPTRLLAFHRSKMRDMITQCESLTTALVHTMSSRIREFTKREQQNDKMMALGKLSAGLAHELNNPSAAIVRSAQLLNKHLRMLPNSFKKVMSIEMQAEQVDIVNDLLYAKIQAGPSELSMMEKAEREDDIVDWLDDCDVPDADELAENLAEFGFEPDDLDEIKEQVGEAHLGAIISWLDQNLTTEKLVGEIEEASGRINKLVTSIKSYTHMDQAPEKAKTDIHKGLENTLTMLNHKLNKLQIKVVRGFEEGLAQPNILASEMNQVWTNLIDNAIDAMESVENRVLTINTSQDGEFVKVVIGDTGTGIPDEIQDKIFDPFFTTKSIGKGTGLGMEVVHRIIKNQHNGSIKFTSKPGNTQFEVCIPIS